jgi:phosphoribosylaminoimidazole-succinocarboxamide synthase
MKPLVEGKTKAVFAQAVILQSKDRVTWGNRWEADMQGKAVLSNTITSNVFRFLKKGRDNHVAFFNGSREDSFVAPYCEMIPLEVVGRSVIDPKSSYKRRNPEVPTGIVLDEPIVEFFLKSSHKVFRGITLPDDDPIIQGLDETGFWVYHAANPSKETPVWIPVEKFGNYGGFGLLGLFEELEGRMKRFTTDLRDGWARLGWQLGDWKGEFGVSYFGELLLADVIDNDSWRLRDQDGVERSKQVCRDRFAELTEDLDIDRMPEADLQAICDQVARECAPHFALVAEMTKRLAA